ncbi:D-alanyl-D-alanine carboxypeptidase family protein [Stenoxybacter acetivorans]|uniref:D-alanyl-D-alanine carboxypeptidase family protein n=1 Tax=Stenoxybacter acetivorans TaxID=422441 RepID=UPI000569CB6F|nr:D-alanyl-D-alanine carboxypeptidase family protein [Stenoxybacter acetivorans]
MFKKIGIFCFTAFCTAAFAAAAPSAPEITAAAYAVEDAQSGQIFSSKGLHDAIEPGALVKMMTAYLAFQALANNELSADRMLAVSEAGWKTEGSRLFLEPKTPIRADELIQGMIVTSGNDAAVTLAEAIAGSETNFVRKMNQEAKKMGLTDTHFENATGLSASGQHSSAADLLRLAKALIQDYPQYYAWFAERSFKYRDLTQPNRNLLLYRDSSVDGIAVGYTVSSGYHLAAASKRQGRRVISVVLGADSTEARATENGKLLNWALDTYETPLLYQANDPLFSVSVYKGVRNTVNIGFLQAAYVSIPANSATELKPILETHQPVVAPIHKGDVLGTLKLMNGDKLVAQKPVVALHDVEASNWFGRMWDGVRLWLKSLFASSS